MTFLTKGAILADRTVGEIAAKLPGATAVFRKYNVDFCCHGDIALGEAARRHGIVVADLERDLRALEASGVATPQARDTGELINHILTRYHATHRRELPELIELAGKVEAVHADHPQVPGGLSDSLRQMLGELEVHMKKEELILFPAMRSHVGGGFDVPIAQMRHDHTDHGAHLERLARITGGFVPPDGACRSWQALYVGTAKLADDLVEHIHIENNVLFPRFEESLRA